MTQRNGKLQPTIFVIFGGSGDLTKRKLIPALVNLQVDDHLPEKFAVIGLGRSEFSNASFRLEIKDHLDRYSRRKINTETWDSFQEKIIYLKSDIGNPESYAGIHKQIEFFEKKWDAKANIIYYLAIAPTLVETVTKNLGATGICKNIERNRLVVEKPFGHDLESARALNTLLTGFFDEAQIYRIDHYLGKEAVQNMLAFRFANILFEPIWNNKFIDHVQITVSETLGVGERGGYYDKSGALRDMIQNHVLQLLCFTAMEPPLSFDADEIRNKKLDVLKAIQRYEGKEVFENASRGQYRAGVKNEVDLPAYRHEKKVSPNSNTDTFAAIKFYVGNWRWQNVPFYVRSGKHLPEKLSKIIIQFKPVPHQVFSLSTETSLSPNRITISIAPETGIKMQFQAKKIGQQMRLKSEDLTFNYSDTPSDQQPEAYETLLHDIMTGDATLFMRSDEVEAAWQVVMPFVKAWAEHPATDFPNYTPNGWGPESSHRLLSTDGRHWIT
jgi:glucose-6-phosphate 1-dehydrogenase